MMRLDAPEPFKEPQTTGKYIPNQLILFQGKNQDVFPQIFFMNFNRWRETIPQNDLKS